MLNRPLTEDELQRWQKNHHLVLEGELSNHALDHIRQWTDDLASRPETPGKWMKYFESTEEQARMLCRLENFMPYNDGFRELLVGEGMMGMLQQLMGEPAVLFKEKINFKLPGGAGFSAHQDAPAFTSFNQRYHITVMIAVDPSTVANGCLEMSDPVDVYTTLEQAADGTIAPEVEAKLPWRALEVPAGSIVFFDSYIPHRSHTNTSKTSRRALYVTYNRASEGDRRSEYFAHKRQVFPPECERIPGKDYGDAGVYNLGNPIR